MKSRLGVNVDHIATLRNARGEGHPDPISYARQVMNFGANSITIHLREDRRHIQDEDVALFSKIKRVPINLEMAANNEMLKIALKYKPNFVCIVPEKRREITTILELLLECSITGEQVRLLVRSKMRYIDFQRKQTIRSKLVVI